MTRRTKEQKVQEAADRIASNQAHHRTWFKKDYEAHIQEIAYDIFWLAEINKRMHEREKAMKWIDTLRRENAVAMSVTIAESDSIDAAGNNQIYVRI